MVDRNKSDWKIADSCSVMRQLIEFASVDIVTLGAYLSLTFNTCCVSLTNYNLMNQVKEGVLLCN